jgi:hypothetical protein
MVAPYFQISVFTFAPLGLCVSFSLSVLAVALTP